jgi:hypothetical protein
MRGRRAKEFRKEAKVKKYGLIPRTIIVNHPEGPRAMYLTLKRLYKKWKKSF